MATIDSLQALLVDQLRDIYDAEKRLTKALPKLVKASTNEELCSALDSHLAETQQQVTRLEKAFKLLGETARAKACAGMRGIIDEGDEHAGEEYDDDGLRDAIIIASAQKAEHYEIAAYGTAIAHARLLGQDDVVELLEQTLEEEKTADRKLTDIAENVVNLDAAHREEDEEGEEAGGMSRAGGARRMVGSGSRSMLTRSSSGHAAADRGTRSARRRR
jgi:ferritin-like metal-binding protein YciE